jgi:hypothetical protein
VGIRKISFIEPSAPGLHIFSKFPIPRLDALLLCTILRERGYKVKTFIEDLAAPDWPFIKSSDIVCISSITSTAIRAYKMAKHLFYSWKYIFRHLARLDFHYAAVGIFGKRGVRKSLKAFSAFLDDFDFNAGERIAHLPHDDVALRKSPVSRSEKEGRIAFDHTILEEVSHV